MENTIGGPEIILLLVVGVCSLVYIGLWVWSLVHCVQNRFLSDSNRVLAIILIALLGLLGSIVYLCLPRESQPQR